MVRLIHHDSEAIAGGFHINLQAERGTGRQRMNPQPEDTSKPKSWKNVLDSVGHLHTLTDSIVAFLGIIGVPVAGLTAPTLLLKLLSWLFGAAIAAGMGFLDLMWLTAPLMAVAAGRSGL